MERGLMCVVWKPETSLNQARNIVRGPNPPEKQPTSVIQFVARRTTSCPRRALNKNRMDSNRGFGPENYPWFDS